MPYNMINVIKLYIYQCYRDCLLVIKIDICNKVDVAHTSRDSPSVTALPPDEGVELADVDSLRDGRSMSRHMQVCLRRVAGGRH